MTVGVPRAESAGSVEPGVDLADEPGILHADLDSFYASVEQRDHPRLRGRPIVVGHGVVLAASYEAKAYGVKTAMNGRQARALCPDLVSVDAHFAAYTAASRAVFDLFRQTTPLVEGISIDEAFLDVRGLRRLAGPAPDIAAGLRRRVAAEVGLPITVGVARSKFLAKVASAVAKPDGLLVVAAGEEVAFLHPLPIERLWGVGKVTSGKLRSRGVTTVGDLAAVGEAGLSALLGPGAGRHLSALARAHDPRRVETGRRRGSIGSQCALGRGRRTAAALDALLISLADRVTRRMRAAGRRGRTVVLRLRFDDFTRATRSHTVGAPTDSTHAVLGVARDLLAGVGPAIAERGLTLLGLSVTGFGGPDAVQLALPFGEPPPRAAAPALDTAMDRVRERFGTGALTRAVQLNGGRELPEMPLLPD